MSVIPSSATASNAAAKLLRWTGVAWFAVAAIGQLAFVSFILAFYGVRTATGDFAAWNDKPLIDGYVAGDGPGNLVFAAHVLLASAVTLMGLMQLLPVLRRSQPALHRWTGRMFLIAASIMALSGVWLSVVRGTYLSVVSAAAILGNALLILIFAGLAWRHAVQRRFDRHRIWAMRTFMVVSGVWFLRVGLMGWVVINQGRVGMRDDLSGPADIVMVFGSYLIPLALLELYFAASRRVDPALKLLAAAAVFAATGYTAAGVFGTIAFMWWPHL